MKINILTNQKKYIFNTFFNTLGIDYEYGFDNYDDKTGILVVYGEEQKLKNSITIIPSSGDDPSIKTIQHPNGMVPIPFSTGITSRGSEIYRYRETPDPVALLLETNDGYQIIVGADLIASAHYFLTFQDEQNPLFAVHRGRPIVAEYMLLLLEFIKILSKKRGIPLLQKWFWPGGERFAICLTHDIDLLKHWWIGSAMRAFEMVKRGRISEILKMGRKAAKALIAGENPFFTFDKFVELERTYGVTSSFLFLTDGGSLFKFIRDYAATYRIEEVSNIIKHLQLLRWDVGLHGSICSYNNHQRLQFEKERLQAILGATEFGIRQHFLKLMIPETWRIQADCKFLFDSTLSDPSTPGFRGGFPFPFYPYDPIDDQQLDILELPLGIMDRTFTKYRKDVDPYREIWTILDITKRLSSLVTILWHNNSVDEGGFPGHMELYEKILCWIKANRGYGTSGRDLAQWWIRRANVELTAFHDDGERIHWTYVAKFSLPSLSFIVYPPYATEPRIDVKGARYEVVRGAVNVMVKLREIAERGTFEVIVSYA